MPRPPRPPGPAPRVRAAVLAAYESDRLGYLLRLRERYGDLVAFDDTTTVVNGPGVAAEVLGADPRFAILGDFLNRRLSAEDARRRTQGRRHLDAGLRPSALSELRERTGAAVVAALGGAMDGSGVDPLPEVERAMSAVVSRFYFGPGLRADVGGATGSLLNALSLVFGNPFALPSWAPTPANLRIRARYRRLHALVLPLVGVRALPGAVQPDYAGVVTRSATAAGLPPPRITDLLIGSLLAAYRVPAAALCWAMLELARAPRWTARVRDEPSALVAVVRESGRLWPPTWLLHRVATEPVSLGGYRFAAGHHFLVSPYVVHRDARLFDAPARFRPERWLAGEADPRDLLTFGRGRHRCPGRDAAGVLVAASLGAIVRTYTVGTASSLVVPQPRTTLVPGGLRLRLGSAGGGGAQLLDPLGEPLPGGLAGDPHRLADLGPGELA